MVPTAPLAQSVRNRRKGGQSRESATPNACRLQGLNIIGKAPPTSRLGWAGVSIVGRMWLPVANAMLHVRRKHQRTRLLREWLRGLWDYWKSAGLCVGRLPSDRPIHFGHAHHEDSPMNLPLQMRAVLRGRTRVTQAHWTDSSTVTPSQGCYCPPECSDCPGPNCAPWCDECCYSVCTCDAAYKKCTCAGYAGCACCLTTDVCICTGNMPGCGS